MDKAPLPPSQTGEEPKKIEVWERTHQSKVVRRLLAEVRRLQAIALRAHQLDECLRETSKTLAFNSAHLVVDCLRRELDELPLIKEREAAVDFILNGHAKRSKRKDRR